MGRVPFRQVILSLVCGLRQAEREGHFFAMLTAYFDDSGTDGNSLNVAIAGWLGKTDEWLDFSREWEAELNRSPRIASLHMCEVFDMSECSPWNGIGPRERQQRVKAFADVIMRRKFTPVSVMVNLEAVLKSGLPGVTKANAAEFATRIAVRDAIEQASRDALRMGLRFGLTVYFDCAASSKKTADFRRIANGVADELRERPASYCSISRLCFASEERELPLQAADLLVWHQNRYKEKPNDVRESRAYDNLLQNGPFPNLINCFPENIAKRGLPNPGNLDDRR